MLRVLVNIPKLLRRSTSERCVCVSRKFSRTSANQFKFRNEEYEWNNISPAGWCLLLVPITTFGLGCWQVQRKQWKESLLRQLETETKSAAIDIPQNLNELDTMEYRPIRVRGKFLHDKEITMGPRSLVMKGNLGQKGGILTQQNTSTGYLIITPFKLDGRDETILINRGWVSRQATNPAARPEGQVTGTVDIIGLVRKDEPRPQFMPKSASKAFLYRDLNKMCELTGAVPVFLDATVESSIPGGPIGGQTVISLRNEHLSYIITWYGLSAVSSVYWIVRNVRQI